MRRFLFIILCIGLSFSAACRDKESSLPAEKDSASSSIIEAETTESVSDVNEPAEATTAQPPEATTEEKIAEEEDDWLTDRNFRLSAHRGAVALAPENTLEAVRAAAEHGYGAVEIDPRLSSDGVIYLMHDRTVDRTTDGSGKVENMSSDKLDSLQIETDDYPEYEGTDVDVPLFEDAVSLLSEYDIVLNIDCSKGDWTDEDYIDQVMGILEKYNMTEKSFFVISDWDARRILHRRYPEACVSWLYESSDDIYDEIAAIKQYPRALLSVKDKYATDRMIRKLNESGIYYQVYKVNDYDRLEELKDMGVPMVETDDLLP